MYLYSLQKILIMISFKKKIKTVDGENISGEPIAASGLKPIYLYSDTDKLNAREFLQDIEAKNVRVLPSINKRDVILAAGVSGSGKSTLMNQFTADYLKIFPKRKVFCFTRFPDDPSLPILKDKRVDTIPEELVDEDTPERFSLEVFKDSLVLFDDVAAWGDVARKNVYSIVKNVAIGGRHYNISAFTTTHNILAGNAEGGAVMRNELTGVFLFPKSAWHQSSSFLKNYMGIDGRTIKAIAQIRSRWVYVGKTFPVSVISQVGVSLI